MPRIKCGGYTGRLAEPEDTMQALSADQYARLSRLAEAWNRCYLKAAKGQPQYNPRLGVDALCFQPHILTDGRSGLLGALVTPVSLSLALVIDDEATAHSDEQRLTLALPSGRYPFTRECLGEPGVWWRCELMDDLSDLDSLQAASRLAQQLMERVMTPDESMP
ncbi:[NiFe]-hydrogenase assembly chaperone HybE [Halomonas aquatica]|uniref:[NiFe]-hydrogenase assembly chaperone HybE n=1 Tax=Halomonas aquatica TaxID=3151123 RepID=A0ABV1NEQ4_9GAMM